MKSVRPYTIGPDTFKARAVRAEATRRRILDAVVSLLKSRFRPEIRLEDVAAGAQVTAQTVKNVFGSKSRLLDEALADPLREVKAQRLRAQPGEPEAGVAELVDHYERLGDLLFRNLAEQADRELIVAGRDGHRQWVKRQFAPQLDRLNAKRRRLLIDALVCICGVYTWKLYRRDMGRSRSETEQAILAMVHAIVREAGAAFS